MRGTKWFDGQDVRVEDLTELEDSKDDEIRRRIVDIAATTGVVAGMVVSNPSAFTLEVSVGTAYNALGEAIIIPTPAQIVVSSGDVTKLLVAQYVEVSGTPVEHPIAGVLNDTRRTDSFTLAMVVTATTNDVILAELQALDGGGNATLDLTQRELWSALIAAGAIGDTELDPASLVVTHLSDIGTGTVATTNPHGLSPADIGVIIDPTPVTHQRIDHSNGIEPTSSLSTAVVTVNSAPAPDQLTIAQLVSGDSILIDGVRLDDVVGLTPTTLTFGSAGANPELFEITLQGDGTVLAELRAQYTASKNVTGVQVVEVSANHANGTFTLAKTTNGGGKLTWDGGEATTLLAPGTDFTGDKFYLLRRGGPNEDQFIVVFVDKSAVPASASDSVQTFTTNVGDDRILLATVPWSGSATGFLGFGDDGTSGAARDKRTFGNLATENIDDDTLDELIFRRFRETRGGTTNNEGGFAENDNGELTGAIASSAGLNVSMKFAIAYVNGKRFAIPETVIAVVDATTSFLFVDVDGVWQTTEDDPRFPTETQSQPPPFALSLEVLAAAGAIAGQTDHRLNLRKETETLQLQIDAGKHGPKTKWLTAAEGLHPLLASVFIAASGSGGGSWSSITSGGDKFIEFSLPLRTGDRVTAITVFGTSGDAGGEEMQAEIFRTDGIAGFTQVSTTKTSGLAAGPDNIGWTTSDTDFTPDGHVMVDESYMVIARLAQSNFGGEVAIFNIKIVYDHP